MRSVRKYTKEFKQEAVKLALQKPNVTEAAKDLGIPAATLHSWIYALKDAQPNPTANQEKHVDIKRCWKKIVDCIKKMRFLKRKKKY